MSLNLSREVLLTTGAARENVTFADRDSTRRIFNRQPVTLNSYVLQTGEKDFRKISVTCIGRCFTSKISVQLEVKGWPCVMTELNRKQSTANNTWQVPMVSTV
jgi:hypothetical protein